MGRAIGLVAFLAVAAIPAVASAAEIHVPGDFRRLRAALDAALPGDVVVVDKGRHRGPIVVRTPGIVIEGRGGLIVAPGSAGGRGVRAGIDVLAEDVTLRGLTFVRGGVLSLAAGTTVEDCVFLRCDEKRFDANAVELHGDRAVARGNEVYGRRWDLSGIRVTGDDAVLEGNLVVNARLGLGVEVVGRRARIVANALSPVEAGGAIVVRGEAALVEINDVEMPEGGGPAILVVGDDAVVGGNAVDASLSGGPSIVLDGDDGTIVDNAVTAAAGTGVVVWGDGSSIERNLVTGAAPVVFDRPTFGHGFAARGSWNVFRGNSAVGAPADGIRLSVGTGNEVDGCEVLGSGGCGILNLAGETSVLDSSFLGNATDVFNDGSFAWFDGNTFDSGSEEEGTFNGDRNEWEDYGEGLNNNGLPGRD
jgi:hypothetical protein